MRWILVAFVAVVFGACVKNPAGTRCEMVCRTEAQCAERLELSDVSYASCVAACTELERTSSTARQVDEHIRCVAEASGCAAIMDCP